jgi:Flp pilus assembly protein TadG
MRRVAKKSSGQALIETALVMPVLLLLALNCVNFGYFFIVALNVAEAPRSGAQYSILGFQTPASLVLPAAGPPSTTTTISYLNQQDMTGALIAPTSAIIQVCSSTVGMTNTGVTKCESCTGTTCGAVNTGTPTPAADPEAPNFVLNRVDVNYVFSPPIPGTVFGLALLPLSQCASGAGGVTCTFHRQVSMREMN